jgi:hypothetical protein
MYSTAAGKKINGSGATARCADRYPPWLSWSAPIKGAADSSVAAAAAHAGSTFGPDARFAKTPKTIASRS